MSDNEGWIAAGGWIENTGRCPVAEDILVDIRVGNCEYDHDGHSGLPSYYWNWSIDGYSDITHWRLHKPVESLPQPSYEDAAEKLVRIFAEKQDRDLYVREDNVKDGPVVSSGGSSEYYKLTITNKAGESIECETGDVLRVLVGNDYDLSNIVKACRRMSEASQGRGKAGASIEYDANKIIYFASEFKHWNKDK